MKRFFFSLIALSAVAVGCTQSALLETPDFGGTEITFEPYTGRTPVTKAESADLAYLQKPSNQGGGFYVYGFLNQEGKAPAVYMDNELVYWDAMWTYDNLVYWPDQSSTSTLSFVAYSANAVGKGLSNVTKDGFTFTVQDDIDNQVDLLATSFTPELSLNSTSGVSDGKVSLDFKHLLSRVGFQIKTTSARQVVINSLTLNGKMYTKGTLKFKDATGEAIPTLTGSEKIEESYSYVESPITFETGATTATAIRPNTYLMIMPHIIRQGDYHTIEVNYQIGNANPKTAVVELQPDFEFEQGKAYEFILNISTSAITFNVTYNDWDSEGGETTVPLDPQPQAPVTLGSAYEITYSSAKVRVTVNVDNLTEAGVAYRKSGETTWNLKKASGTSKIGYDVALADLTEYTSYEYCAYAKTGEDVTYYPESDFPVFKTYANVTLAGVNNDTDKTSNSVTLTGGFNAALVDQIKEYGFCYIAGYTDTPPSITSENSIKVTENTSGSFSGTINGLNANKQYSCWAYVKTADDMVSYSPVQQFKTKFAVDSDDDTGAGWD